jgi:two-component system chemotaxis response regulator CheB
VNRDIVAIGASAGGLEALSAILSGLPGELPATVFIVMHTAPNSPGYLVEILSNAGPLPVRYARNGERFRKSAAYIAPPDHHLLLSSDGKMEVVRGPRENRTRPAVDPLFRSAALAFGSRVVGIVLSGGLDDGTAGLRGIKMCGGVAVVQDPADALVSSMPASALRNVSVDYCKPAQALADLISHLVQGEAPAPVRLENNMRNLLEIEVEIAKGRASTRPSEFGDASLFTCPECHGTLMRIRGERPPRYRCHTGHAFTGDSLLAELSEATEEAIWNAIRSLQENSMLMSHLADHWREANPAMAAELLRNAKAAQERADAMRGIAAEHPAISEEKARAEAT